MQPTRQLFRGSLSSSEAAALTAQFRGLRQNLLTARASVKGLLCVIPFALHEVEQTVELLDWMLELGGCPQNPCLLVADCRFPASELPGILDRASKCFLAVDFIQTPHALPDESWPKGPNWMFRTALEHIAAHYRRPWWWNEPDCIPLRSGWLLEWERHYWRARQPFMGCVIQPTAENPCQPHLTGCAVYPHYAARMLKPFADGPEAWDYASRSVVLPHTAHTALFHSEWGAMGHPPTFKSAEELSRISPRAVVYHRNKDGSLIRFLRQRQP